MMDVDGGLLHPVDLCLAAHDRPICGGELRLMEWLAPDGSVCVNGCRTIPGIPPTGCRT